jgi:hypothetical protein
MKNGPKDKPTEVLCFLQWVGVVSLVHYLGTIKEYNVYVVAMYE